MPRSPHRSVYLSEQDHAIHDVLADWFAAMQDGTAEYRMPDPSYKRPPGAEEWTNGKLAVMLSDLDEYVIAPAQRNYAATNYGIEADAGPGYMRLGHAQRVALAQDLERAILAHPEPDKPYPVPKVGYADDSLSVPEMPSPWPAPPPGGIVSPPEFQE